MKLTCSLKRASDEVGPQSQQAPAPSAKGEASRRGAQPNSAYSPEELIGASLGDDPVEVFGSYDAYEREIVEGDVQDFIDGDSEWLHTEAWSTLQVGITIISHSGCQYRWIDTPDGRAMVQRKR